MMQLITGGIMDYAENYLLQELESLENEYADLDVIVFDDLSLDPVTVQRVKKRKLWIKDRISSIKSVLYPEVIA
jgi:hypothetical protein